MFADEAVADDGQGRPLAGRLIGWNAFFAALVAAALVAGSAVQLRSGEALSAGDTAEAAAAADAPALQAAMPEVAAAPAQEVNAGMCNLTFSDSGEFALTEAATLEVPGFTGEGELTSVQVQSSITLLAGGTVTNTNPVSEATGTILVFNYNGSVTGPGVSTVATETIDIEQELAPAETVDVAPAVISDVSNNVELTGAAISAYQGGTVAFDVASFGLGLVGGLGDVRGETETLVRASVTVTYCVTPPPPESVITVSKTVVAGSGADIPSFTFTINCGGADVSFELRAGQSVPLPLDVPDGTPCTVTETAVDTGRWVTEVNGVCGNSISVVTPAEAAFTNTLRAGSETPLGACA